MKKFDQRVTDKMNELGYMESWDDVNWKKLTIELFLPRDTPAKFKNMNIRNASDWRNFICYYSMDKVNINADWLSKELKEKKREIKEEDLDMKDILADALKEIGEKAV